MRQTTNGATRVLDYYALDTMEGHPAARMPNCGRRGCINEATWVVVYDEDVDGTLLARFLCYPHFEEETRE